MDKDKVSMLTHGWIECEHGKNLPPTFKPVLCLLTNGCLVIDWVNQPDHISAPFAHYLVGAWQDIDIELNIDMSLKISKNHVGTEVDPTVAGYKVVVKTND